MHRAFVLGLCFALFTLQPTLGGATIVQNDYSRTTITVAAPVANFFDYAQASSAVWSTTADFATGALTGATNSDDSITLTRIGPPGVELPTASISWWDTDWASRQCFAIDHANPAATTVIEYQLRLEFPIEMLVDGEFVQADLGDLRAVSSGGSGPLPLWIDDTTENTIWVQMDSIAAGTTENLCIYYGYREGIAATPANHTEAAVFSYDTPHPIYYAVSSNHTVSGADINVVTYTDGNEVVRSDGVSAVLTATGDLVTFVGTTTGSAFSVLGPISANTAADGLDTLVPISFAGTHFAIPISRDNQQFSFLAPFGDAIVELYDGPTLAATFPVTSATPYTHVADDTTPGNTAIVESDVPVLLVHTSEVGGDSLAVYPARPGDFYGVRSTELLIGLGTDATAIEFSASDATTGTTGGNRGEAVSVDGGAVQGGSLADSILLSTDQPVAVVAHEDGDGSESATVLPAAELGSRYWIPTDSQYVALSCPTTESAAVAITISPPAGVDRPVSCAGGPAVAWGADTADLAVTALRGIEVAADAAEPFSIYYEVLSSDDQSNVLGMKQGRQYTWPEPVITGGAAEGLYESGGTWESATFNIGPGTGIYGRIGLAGDVPADTSLLIQLATAAAGLPSDFVGPDGTAASYFTLATLPSVADFDHDGERFLRVKADLATTDPAVATPRLDLISVDHHLAPLNRSLSGPPVIAMGTSFDPSATSTYVLRVTSSSATTAGSEATVAYRGGTNVSNLALETVRLANVRSGLDAVQHSASLPIDPPALFDTGHPHSVVIDTSAIASGVTRLSFAWQLDHGGSGSIFSEIDFDMQVTAP